MTERVLITGASGFLGYHIILSALDKKMEVFAAVRKTSDIKHLKDLPLTYVYLNFESIGEMQELINKYKINYIIHAAGATKALNQVDYDTINATYSINLAKAASLSSTYFKKLVFISSLAACGPSTSATDCINELISPKPLTAYGRSKLLAEIELSKLPLPLVILRPTAIYGPRDKDIFIILKTINKGLDPYLGKILQQLSFVHAHDVAAVAVQSLVLNKVGTYVITDGNSYSRYTFADIAKNILRKKAIRFHIPMALVKILAGSLEITNGWIKKTTVINREKLLELAARNWSCDISKAKDELNFKPIYNLENGLINSIEWYQLNKLI